MKELFTHLNCFNLNSSQYWIVPDIYQCSDFEVSWSRARSGNAMWRIRLKGNECWDEFDHSYAIREFSRRGIDLVELRKCIEDTILKQAVYAMQVTNSAKQVLGEAAVDDAVTEAELLVEELVQKIKKAVKPNKTKQAEQRLTLVRKK